MVSAPLVIPDNFETAVVPGSDSTADREGQAKAVSADYFKVISPDADD